MPISPALSIAAQILARPPKPPRRRRRKQEEAAAEPSPQRAPRRSPSSPGIPVLPG